MNKLNTPIHSNNLDFKNRLVMPPMATSKAENGIVTQALIDYYKEKSEGGYIGLIITEHSYVSLDGKASQHQTSISRDEDIEGLKQIVHVIHANGSKVFAQISHAGSRAKEEVTTFKPIAPSAIPWPNSKEITLPLEMSIQDIENTVNHFVKAASRAKMAGFDGIEIHVAHGYLLNQFYSPLTNKRTDEYGGSLANRILIITRIIKEIRKELGSTYPIALRLGACDYMEGGSTISDAIEAAEIFEENGIDLIHISGGLSGFTRPNHQEAGYFQDVAEAIKNTVQIPVILTGGITTKEEADCLLNQNKADMIGVGRAIFKNSNWAKENMK